MLSFLSGSEYDFVITTITGTGAQVATVATAIEKTYNSLKMLSPSELVKNRMEKYLEMGEFKG